MSRMSTASFLAASSSFVVSARLRGGLGTQLGIGQAKLDPALFRRWEFNRRGL